MSDNKEELFEQLYHQYYHMCYRFILSKVRDPWTTEDILSEVFMKIYKHRNEISDVSKSSSWILKIANNTIIDSFRKNNRIDLDSEMTCEAVYEIGYENILIKDEFNTVTENLPCDIRKMLTMRFCLNLKFREIGRIMNLPENTAKRRVYKALQTAREIYNYKLQNA